VESISKAKIMTPDQYGNFNPKQPVTRAQMAQILSNLDSVYFPIAGLERRTGTVAGIRDGQAAATLTAGLQRTVYVRSADGKMDHLVCAYTDTPSPQNMTLDAVTYRAGIVSGLTALEEGDEIEYIVNPLKKSAVYVYVTKTVSVREVSGFLAGLDYENRSLTISGSGEKKFSYRLAQGLLTRQAGAEALIMSGKAYPAASLPYGAVVALRLVNDTVTEITYKGQPELVSEIRGIVLENDADLGFLTIIDNNGKRVTKQYTEGSMKVRKRQYYDQDDAVGYFVNMFPHFDYDPLETEIADVEPGDVVFLTLNRSDADVIESVSASVNYQSRYGKIRSIVRGADEFSIVVEYENKQTGSFSVAGGIFVSSGGRPITQNEIQTGDWARFLVNEAIIEPGRSLESVKEIVIEGGEHFISGLYKGSLSGVNAIQATIALEGAQELDKTGWVNYRDIANFNIKNKDVEFYDGGRRVSLDYCAKRYKNGGVTAYVATEAAYSGERVTRVTFRAGRDEALDADVALSADGGGAFEVLSRAGRIETDDGTIVRRFGRLVGGTDIEPSDYVRVVLNGGGKAAIVDITSEPDTSRVMIARGRIASVNGTSSFKTQSISQLSGTSWVYTPVQREYAIDGKTVFLNESGYSDPAAFMDYTENSVVDRVYNIVTDGSRAAFVIDAPYAYRAVRGTVYQNEDGVLRIKDVYALNENTDQWQAVSAVNNTAAVTVYPNTITARDNAVISAGALVNGDRVLIMTNRVPALTAGMAIDGYIVIVER
jgi:hypothetical protein